MWSKGNNNERLRKTSLLEKIFTIILEITAFLVEGLIYKKTLEYKRINGFLLSLILNISSYVLGILINSLIW